MSRALALVLLLSAGVAAADPDEVRPPVAADLDGYAKKVPGKGELTATIATNLGTIHCQLFPNDAPMTVASFIGLATGQKPWTDPKSGNVVRHKRFYDGLTFHRVIPEFMIQGGDPLGEGTGGPGFQFADETQAGLIFQPGSLAMANAGPGTNGSQFFVTETATEWLQGHHTIFGQCSDLEVVKKIARAPHGDGDRPTKPVVITKLTIGRAPKPAVVAPPAAPTPPPPPPPTPVP
jgi:peptidyl-prolyl cis-trans isomerase A (cyclophilin A)